MKTYKFTICKPHGSGNKYCHSHEVYATNEENAKVAFETYCRLKDINLKKYTIENIEEND